MHVDFAPDIAGGAMFPYLEGMVGQAFGRVIGKGGADMVTRALDHVSLPGHFASRHPQELSGGQRQRVGIARVIAPEPDFILADEIASGLDGPGRAQVLNLPERLVRDLGLTLAFIRHDLSVIRRLCHRTIVHYPGRIVEDRATDALFAAPQAEYARELRDAIPLPDPAQPLG
jgi:peptide/nickel transport system ATP-binding protein